MLVEAGSTIGGVVASGLSGPGRFRYGGVRDFILGVRLVDGAGRLLRLGGKVVKNAAGFDVPKFLVGSLGRFGALGEVTFKVFPKPAATLTLRLHAVNADEATRVLTGAANSRFEFDALDVPPGGPQVLARLAGPPEALHEEDPRQGDVACRNCPSCRTPCDPLDGTEGRDDEAVDHAERREERCDAGPQRSGRL